MDIERTLAIISALADGRDPHATGTLPADHVCQQPDVIRALHQAREIVAREARLQRARQRARLVLPRNTGRAWSADEERVLALRFRAGRTVAELAEAHGRTAGGIRSRLALLGLMADVRDGRSNEAPPRSFTASNGQPAPAEPRLAPPSARPYPSR